MTTYVVVLEMRSKDRAAELADVRHNKANEAQVGSRRIRRGHWMLPCPVLGPVDELG